MDATPINIHVSIFTKCGKWSVTRVTPANLGGIHTTAQELLGMTVKEFRKKLATDVIDAEPVSVGSLSLKSENRDNSTLLKFLKENPDISYDLPISEIDYVDAQLAQLTTRVADLEAILKANDIRMREPARPRVLSNLRDTLK